MRQRNSASLNRSVIGVFAVLLACKTPPETAAPSVSTVEEAASTSEASSVEEAESESVDQTGEQVADGQEDQGVDLASEEQVTEAEGEASDEEVVVSSAKKYAEPINDAVALLSSETSLQAGLHALEDISLEVGDLPQVFYNIGVAHVKLNNLSAAEEAFRKSTQVDPSFAKSWANLGVIYERRQDYGTAFDLYSEGLSHNATDADLIAGQIACLRKLKRYPEAIEYAQVALKKNASNISAYNEVGAVYLEQKEYDKAGFIFAAAEEIGGTENAVTQASLGRLYYEEEKFVLAKNALSKAVELDPNLIDAALLLSFIHLDNRAWAAAEAVLRNAIALEPNNAALLNTMGIAKRGLGEIDEAEKMYREALAFEPDNPEPLLNLAVLEADYRNKYDEAFALLEEYSAAGGGDTEIVKEWSEAFEASKEAYEREQKRREFFLKRQKAREEAERQAEEERKRQEALQETEEDSTDGDSEQDENLEQDVEAGDDVEQGDASENDEVSGEDAQDGTGEDSDSNGADEGDDAPVEDDVESGEQSAEQEAEAQENSVPEDDSAEGTWGAPVEPTEQGVPDVVQPEAEINRSAEDLSSSENEQGEGDISVEDSGQDENSVEEGSPEQPIDQNEGSWGENVVSSCDAIDSCEDLDLQCSQFGSCISKGQPGTYEQGESCTDTSECAFGLECQEQMCFSGGE